MSTEKAAEAIPVEIIPAEFTPEQMTARQATAYQIMGGIKSLSGSIEYSVLGQVKGLALVKNEKLYRDLVMTWAEYCDDCRINTKTADRYIARFNDVGYEFLSAVDNMNLSNTTIDSLRTLPKELMPHIENDAVIITHLNGDVDRIPTSRENRDALQTSINTITSELSEANKLAKKQTRDHNSSENFMKKQISELADENERLSGLLGNRTLSADEIETVINDSSTAIIEACHGMEAIDYKTVVSDTTLHKKASGTIVALKSVVERLEAQLLEAQANDLDEV